MKTVIAALCACMMLAACSKDPSAPTAADAPPKAPVTLSSAPASAQVNAPAEQVSAPAPTPPAPPPHNYSYYESGQYGYEAAISDTDRKDGVVAKPLQMYRYIGIVDGRYIVESIQSNTIAARAACESPCEFAKVLTVSTFGQSNTQVMRLPPDSILAEVFTDAMNGQLEPARSSANYLFPASWSPSAPAAAPAAPLSPAPQPAVMPAMASATVPAVQPQSTSDSASDTTAAPPQYQTSFDCNKARSDAEHMICANADLAAADRELSELFARAKAAVTDQTAFRDRMRTEWNYREQHCHDKECIARWYADEKASLEHTAQTGTL